MIFFAGIEVLEAILTVFIGRRHGGGIVSRTDNTICTATGEGNSNPSHTSIVEILHPVTVEVVEYRVAQACGCDIDRFYGFFPG